MKKQETKKPELKSKTITIKTAEENPEPLELIAAAILQVADGFDKINSSKLKRRAVVLLLQDVTKMSATAINRVLDSASDLRSFVKS